MWTVASFRRPLLHSADQNRKKRNDGTKKPERADIHQNCPFYNTALSDLFSRVLFSVVAPFRAHA